MLSIPGVIPVKIHPFFWLLAFLIGWMSTASFVGTIVWMVVILVSVLVHEFGHALTAHYYGHRAQIELVGLGGVTQRVGPKLSWWKEFIIVLDGPMAGFFLAIVAYQLRSWMGDAYTGTLFAYSLEVTFIVNVFWTIVNLLPIMPLDGGHLLMIMMDAFFGLKGVKITLFFSFILGALISVVFFVQGAFLAGAIFILLTIESYRSWTDTLSVTVQDRSDELQNELQEAKKAIHLGDEENAMNMLNAVRKKSQSGVIFMAATENLATILTNRGEYQQAYALLKPQKKNISSQGLKLYHRLAFHNRNIEEAIKVGNQIFQNYPNYETAVRNAQCHALLDEERAAVGWLHSAVREGLPNIDEVVMKSEFDHIRQGELFQKLLDKK